MNKSDDIVIRPVSYFAEEQFDCNAQHLLEELATRAELWFRATDGTYHIPRVNGQVEQIIEMAIAAHMKLHGSKR